jgi:Ca2+/H+ antiporter
MARQAMCATHFLLILTSVTPPFMKFTIIVRNPVIAARTSDSFGALMASFHNFYKSDVFSPAVTTLTHLVPFLICTVPSNAFHNRSLTHTHILLILTSVTPPFMKFTIIVRNPVIAARTSDSFGALMASFHNYYKSDVFSPAVTTLTHLVPFLICTVPSNAFHNRSLTHTLDSLTVGSR